MAFIGWAIFIYCLIFATRIIHAWQLILKQVIPYKANIKREEEPFLPEYMSDLYNDFQKKINNTEFELFDCYSHQNIYKQLIPITVYKSKNKNTFITITAPCLDDNPNQLSVMVSSISDDNREVAHNNFRALLSFVPLPHETHINALVTWEDLLVYHQKYLSENDIHVSQHNISAQELFKEIQSDIENRFNNEVNKNKIHKTEHGYRFTISYALIAVIKCMFTQKKPSQENIANLDVLEKQPVTTARQTYFFDMFEEINKTVLDAKSKWVFFTLSLVASILLGAIVFDMRIVIALTIVIFIHELGHWLAMRYFGYRNAQLFFIPLLGGGAKANIDKLSHNHKAWMLLMGSLPGIIIGFAIMSLLWFDIFDYTYVTMKYLKIYGSLFLFINVIKLLPFRSLDDGQLFNILLPKNTLIKTIITVTASVIAVALAYYFDMYILCFIFALPLLFQFTQRKANTIIRTININASKKEIFLQLCKLNPNEKLSSHYQSARNLHLESNAVQLNLVNRMVIIVSLVLLLALLVAVIMISKT